MKVQQVIMQALSGAISWVQAAEILGLEPRSVRRWRARFEAGGPVALYDRRRVRPSRRKAPALEVQRILRLYRERFAGWNVRHFYRFARRDHAVTLSYSFVKLALQEAGLVAQGPGARASSPAAGAPRLFRRAAPPRRQPPCLAAPLPRRTADAPRGPRRRHQALALRPALARRVDRRGLHGPAGGLHGVGPADRALHRSRRLGFSHPDGRRPRRPAAPHPGRPGPCAPRHRAHRRLLAPGPRPRRAPQPHGAGSPRQRTPSGGHHYARPRPIPT